MLLKTLTLNLSKHHRWMETTDQFKQSYVNTGGTTLKTCCLLHIGCSITKKNGTTVSI